MSPGVAPVPPSEARHSGESSGRRLSPAPASSGDPTSPGSRSRAHEVTKTATGDLAPRGESNWRCHLRSHCARRDGENRAQADSVALGSHGASRDGFRRAELALRKPAPDPPRGRVSPAGSAPARSRGRAPDRGFVVVLITGPVRVLVPVPVLSFALVLHAGAGCAPARGRRWERLRARSRRESGHRLIPRPRRRTGAAGEAAPREPAGVPPGPVTTPGGCGPGRCGSSPGRP